MYDIHFPSVTIDVPAIFLIAAFRHFPYGTMVILQGVRREGYIYKGD